MPSSRVSPIPNRPIVPRLGPRPDERAAWLGRTLASGDGSTDSSRPLPNEYSGPGEYDVYDGSGFGERDRDRVALGGGDADRDGDGDADGDFDGVGVGVEQSATPSVQVGLGVGSG